MITKNAAKAADEIAARFNWRGDEYHQQPLVYDYKGCSVVSAIFQSRESAEAFAREFCSAVYGADGPTVAAITPVQHSLLGDDWFQVTITGSDFGTPDDF